LRPGFSTLIFSPDSIANSASRDRVPAAIICSVETG